MDTELLYLTALLKVQGIGPVTARNLISYSGGVEAVFKQRPAALRKIPEVGPKTPIERIVKGETLSQAEEELKQMQALGARALSFLQSDYPDALRTLTNAPLLLFALGNLDFNQHIGLSIVGTRTPTDYGKTQTRRFARHFAEGGFNVVSGLAFGIDIEAHKETLAAGGITTAVVAHGLDKVYPAQHKAQAKQIVENGGAILTEFFLNTPADAINFPSRNRIIAGLSKATVIIEAAETGGSILTASLANDHHREVFALPGPVHSERSKGCHKLIREHKAALVTAPEEVLEELNLAYNGRTAEAAQNIPLLSAEELEIYHHLNLDGILLDDLALRTNRTISHLMSTLLAMEFKGAVRQLPGRKFVRA
jgi:DNA processing protein